MKLNLKLLWIKIQIAFLKPCVWVEDKINKYDEWRLRKYIEWECNHQLFINTLNDLKKESK